MRRGPTAASIRRVVRAVKSAGAKHVRVEIEGEKIIVTELEAAPVPRNELDQWLEANAGSS